MKAKICGITNLADALVATEAGADYLGFIFYPPSKRAVTVAQVQEMVPRLRAELRASITFPGLVGVFVNETAEHMAHVLDQCRLDLAQLNGDEAPSMIGDPASPLYGRSFKVLQPATFAEAEADAEWFMPPEPAPDQPTLLLDAYHPTLRGGTGHVADWGMAARLVKAVPGLMLAGGLKPENVAAAVRQVRPFAVDVASGVEREPGRKDHEKVRAFIARAKAA